VFGSNRHEIGVLGQGSSERRTITGVPASLEGGDDGSDGGMICRSELMWHRSSFH
jgi:hypothetical protein